MKGTLNRPLFSILDVFLLSLNRRVRPPLFIAGRVLVIAVLFLRTAYRKVGRSIVQAIAPPTY